MVDWLATTALWGLGFAFGYSGASKLRNVRLTAMTLVDFGVMSRPRAGAGLAVGTYEVALAAALFTGIAGIVPSRIPAALAVVTLVAFSVLLVRGLRSGADFACNCFGASSEPISSSDVTRNVVLAATGVVAMVGPATIDQAHVPSAPISAAAGLLSVSLVAAVLTLRTVNTDPLGEDLSRWERRLYGN